MAFGWYDEWRKAFVELWEFRYIWAILQIWNIRATLLKRLLIVFHVLDRGSAQLPKLFWLSFIVFVEIYDLLNKPSYGALFFVLVEFVLIVGEEKDFIFEFWIK